VPATEILLVNAVNPEPPIIARAASCLRGGGLVAFPTETVYGLGVHALDRAAVRRLFDAKGRPATDPLIVHVGSVEQAASLVTDLPDSARRLADAFWPGPLTLIMTRAPHVPDEVTAGLATVAVRLPAHPVARALIAAAGVPVAAPSANRFSRPSPTQSAHVFDDLRDRIDMILDAGSTSVGVESTVLDLSAAVPTILRPGAITAEMLRTVLPHVAMRRVTAADGEAAVSPGLLSRHYAPATPLTLFEGDEPAATHALVADARHRIATGGRVALLVAREDLERIASELEHDAAVVLVDIGTRGDGTSIARRLYAAIREADAVGADAILVTGSIATGNMAEAVRDRLRRAAAHVSRG
jgi:L-threonylcarbamoyladenylate synthase